MEPKRIEEARQLLDKFRNGRISPEEEILLYRWFHQYRSDISVDSFDSELAALEERLGDQLETYVQGSIRRQRRVAPAWYWAAASVVLAFVAVALYFVAGPYVSAEKLVQHDHAPGGNKAVLVLENGRQVPLGDGYEGNIINHNNYEIRQTADSGLVYQIGKTSDAKYTNDGDAPSPTNTLLTPRGGQYKLTLPDGTLVWLNSDSRITYPVRFDDVREVTVVGEAYFDVTRDENRPFRVHVGEQLVEVLGTEFNVNAYPGGRSTKTVLVSGSVNVSLARNPAGKVTLKPGEFAQVEPDVPNVIGRGNADLAKATAWRNGDFYFDGETLPEIMDVIARWYDVEVVYQTDLANKGTFGGMISRSRKLSAVLQMLESTGKIKFKITEKEVVVMD
ncbi:FecR protein [Parapedobacter composti]|uniref:FecR protein n=1 Tax=Parapedobacter composti TaxID=623281 RepID=A0A1I1HYQ2_9SPHI|nr:FecR domain-containing protein [Parapedobacter composti]SFC27088.1 FecR protein [Parapedobacter composti]